MGAQVVTIEVICWDCRGLVACQLLRSKAEEGLNRQLPISVTTPCHNHSRNLDADERWKLRKLLALDGMR
jgi:hypothetical protein